MTSPGPDFPADVAISEAALDPSEIALLRCIDRLEEVLRRESRQLRDRQSVDFDRCNDRKAYALFEFSRLVRAIGRTPPVIVFRRLEELQAQLMENEQLLAQNVRALGEIADLLVNIISAESSDGTYSAPRGPGRR